MACGVLLHLMLVLKMSCSRMFSALPCLQAVTEDIIRWMSPILSKNTGVLPSARK